MEEIVQEAGFAVEQHLTESDVAVRDYEGRTTGPRPTMPARLLVVRWEDPVPDSGLSTDTRAASGAADGTAGRDGGGV
jgi:hypothetical protein